MQIDLDKIYADFADKNPKYLYLFEEMINQWEKCRLETPGTYSASRAPTVPTQHLVLKLGVGNLGLPPL